MNKVINKVACAVGAIFCAAGAHAAETPKVTLGGFSDVSYGVASGGKELRRVDPTSATSPLRSNKGIVNDTKIDLGVSTKVNTDLSVGGRIRLNVDTSRDADDDDDNVADKTMLFAESKTAGRLEAGAYDSASKAMQVSANSIAAGSGGIDGYVPKWLNDKNVDGSSLSKKFIKWPELITDCNCISFSNKVTYYSHKLAGLQVGLSYTPDSAIHGTVTELKRVPRHEDANFRDVVNYGVVYEANAKDLSFTMGLTGQFGKAKRLITPRANMNVWELGAVIKLKGFSLAGSYSDWNKTGTPTTKVAGKRYGASFWTAGIGYEYQKFSSSITYFNSKRANVFAGAPVTDPAQLDSGFNRMRYVVFGMDYKVTPGFKPYLEVARYDSKLHDANIRRHGYVTLVGTRLTF